MRALAPPPPVRALRDAMRASLAEALRAVDVPGRVAAAMPRVPKRATAVTLVAIGKAAAPMMEGALAVVRQNFARAVLVEPAGSPVSDFGRGAARVEWLQAPHPDPDRRSVAAARVAREAVAEGDFVVALVSGGASSLLCWPRTIPLARYVRIVRALLVAGANVRDVNVVRRHLCEVKGGGLARVARGPVHTLVVSDVLGGALHDVGSGPTVTDPTTRAQARAILRRFTPRMQVPPLRESMKPGDPRARSIHARFVARPEDLAEAIGRALRARGLRATPASPSVAPVEDLAREYLERARTLAPGEAVVRCAEPSVRVAVRRPGRGGRSTHLGLLVAQALPEGVVFLAGATDGVDGSSGTAGALVDASIRQRATEADIARAIVAFDSAAVLLPAAMALPPGPTRQNFADLHVLARVP